MTADDVWARWIQDVERIKKDAQETFWLRRQFREIAELFEHNHQLQRAGSNLWLYFIATYAATILMRFRRETDAQPGTVNLRNLLLEIEWRPDVITRRRLAEQSRNPDELIRQMLDDRFTRSWARSDGTGGPDDRLDTEKVIKDRLDCEGATTELEEVANRTIAHRTRKEPASTEVKNVGAIFDFFEDLLTRYVALITGASLVGLEPAPQYDTLEPFTFPWEANACRKWAALDDHGTREEGD